MIADPTMTLKFMGREGEEAVLVTRDRTYAVRKGETSNTQAYFSALLYLRVENIIEGKK